MEKTQESINYFALIVAYLPFVAITLGVLGNTSAFLVFRLDSDLKKLSSMMILSFLVVVDTFSLFIWNLDHFYIYYYGVNYEFKTVVLCRIMLFIQYVSLQSSGWLLSLLCLNRYITVMRTPGSIYFKLPISTINSSRNWSIGIIVFFALLNFHSLMFHGYYDSPKLVNETIYSYNANNTLIGNKTMSKWFQSDDTHCGTYTTGFKFYPTWDIVQIYIYSLVPFSLIFTFNSLLIVKTINLRSQLKRNKNDVQALSSFRKKKRLTVSLIAISVAFVVMTLPSSIVWGYFVNETSEEFRGLVDFISFLNHSSVFWTSYLTNYKFRTVVNKSILKICYCRSKANNNVNNSISMINTKITNG